MYIRNAIFESTKDCSPAASRLAQEIEADEPSILNSNLLPVKANGEVLFLSVVSFGNFGRTWTPIFRSSFSFAS